jgi:hypothetical protein
MATKAQLFAKPKPNPKYQGALDYLRPFFNVAIKKAENNPRNFGVLSKQVNSPSEANQVLNESIDNNFWRWLQTSPDGVYMPKEKFVDFMQQRWAPIGAANDPDNLNVNWAPNVRKFLRKQLGQDEYERWKRLNLVQVPWSVNDADPNALEKIKLKGIEWDQQHPAYGRVYV